MSFNNLIATYEVSGFSFLEKYFARPVFIFLFLSVRHHGTTSGPSWSILRLIVTNNVKQAFRTAGTEICFTLFLCWTYRTLVKFMIPGELFSGSTKTKSLFIRKDAGINKYYSDGKSVDGKPAVVSIYVRDCERLMFWNDSIV